MKVVVPWLSTPTLNNGAIRSTDECIARPGHDDCSQGSGRRRTPATWSSPCMSACCLTLVLFSTNVCMGMIVSQIAISSILTGDRSAKVAQYPLPMGLSLAHASVSVIVHERVCP